MRSVMNYNFSQVPRVSIERSVFNRSHGVKTAFNVGYLVPLLVDEVVPGDTFSIRQTIFGRLATPVFPIMDNLWLETFAFYAPCRILWENFKKFMGEKKIPSDTTEYSIPQLMTASNGSDPVAENSLADYLGIPIGVHTGLNNAHFALNDLPFRMYTKTHNEWFRDQNLMTAQYDATGDGPRIMSHTINECYEGMQGAEGYIYEGLLKVCKMHDYFTSALPWPQKGDAVMLPLGDTAPVIGNGKAIGLYGTNTAGNVFRFGLGVDSGSHSLVGDDAAKDLNAGTGYISGQVMKDLTAVGLATSPTTPGYMSNIITDLSEATAATINDIRLAFQLQKMLEKDARGGSRYNEQVLVHFGVTIPDYRTQRVEFLGSAKSRIQVNPVQQTAEGTNPVGHLAAQGFIADSNLSITKSFVEHGYIMILACIRADLTYQQGLSRLWSRETKYDFYWPGLAHLGEQEVLQKEIYLESNETNNAKIFGYQERWAEYRYFPSKITGQMRSTAATPLDAWHLSEEFGSAPELNQTFIQDNTPIQRCIYQTDQVHAIVDVYYDMKCARPMPVYSVPGLIDHF